MIVTTRHFFTIPWFSHRCGYCRNGGKAWFARHGLDWADFVRNGIPAEKMAATGDALGLALVAWARECEAREREDREALDAQALDAQLAEAADGRQQ